MNNTTFTQIDFTVYEKRKTKLKGLLSFKLTPSGIICPRIQATCSAMVQHWQVYNGTDETKNI